MDIGFRESDGYIQEFLNKIICKSIKKDLLNWLKLYNSHPKQIGAREFKTLTYKIAHEM